MYTPHTGLVEYDAKVDKICSAEVTIEDSLFLSLLQLDGQMVIVHLELEASQKSDSVSYNIMGDIIGSKFPNEVVVIGSQMDTWDVGQGALSGAGVAMLMEVFSYLVQVKPKPIRTIRFVGWTNKENGGRGGKSYADNHGNETVFALEVDGMFAAPTGFTVFLPESSSFVSMPFLATVTKLLKHIGANSLTTEGLAPSPDITPLIKLGIPGAKLNILGSNDEYYWYQNSNADSIEKLKASHMNRATASLAVMGYCVANNEEVLKKEDF